MKWTGMIIVAAWAMLAPQLRADSTSADESQQALVERSGEQLKRVRQELDATARRLPLNVQNRFARVYDALSQAEQALVALKSAQPSEVEQVRSRLEESTAKALRLWHELPTNPSQLSAKK